MYKKVEIPFSEIPQFSHRDIAYQNEDPSLRAFYSVPPRLESFKSLIQLRQNFTTERDQLADQLTKQYQGISLGKPVGENIERLRAKNCYTLVTAHQPSILTGPLYFIYKICSAIKLSQQLQTIHPEFQFVPCFILGGEDHDFEEIATLNLFGKSFRWHSDQNGATGRMKIDEGLIEVIGEVISSFGSSSFSNELKIKIEGSLSGAKTYAEFMFRLVHSIFSNHGVVIINMDHQVFKKQFLSIAIDELKNRQSHQLVNKDQEALNQLSFKSQAHAREINLFLHINQRRERIVDTEDGFVIGDKKYLLDELIQYITNNPESISPNVILRPLFQELILPNLAYIGGGGEIAYWLERKSLFEHYKIPFPMLIRRDSVMILDKRSNDFLMQCGLNIQDLFSREEQISAKYAQLKSDIDIDLSKMKEEISAIFSKLDSMTASIDPTLIATVASEENKALKSMDYLENKLLKSEKQKNEIAINKLLKIKQKLFPGNDGLQERHDNFISYYLKYGESWINALLENLDPMNKNFKILIED